MDVPAADTATGADRPPTGDGQELEVSFYPARVGRSAPPVDLTPSQAVHLLGDAQRAETVGGVIEREASIHISNVMLMDPKEAKPTRIGIERENGERRRVAKRSNTKLD